MKRVIQNRNTQFLRERKKMCTKTWRVAVGPLKFKYITSTPHRKIFLGPPTIL